MSGAGIVPERFKMLRYNKIAAAVIVATLGLQFPAFAQEDKVVAKVGDLEIHQSELDLAMGNLDPQLAQLPDEQKKVAALSGAIDVKLASREECQRRRSGKDRRLQEAHGVHSGP